MLSVDDVRAIADEVEHFIAVGGFKKGDEVIEHLLEEFDLSAAVRKEVSDKVNEELFDRRLKWAIAFGKETGKSATVATGSFSRRGSSAARRPSLVLSPMARDSRRSNQLLNEAERLELAR